MRLLSALFVSVLAGTTLAPQIADACGGGYVRFDPAPRMLMVSNHGARRFVVLEQSFDLDGNARWQRLVPDSFDQTQVVALSPLAQPMELTLVGPSGVRVIKTTKQLALARDARIGVNQKRVALEVDVPARDGFVIAIAGNASDAKWHAIDYHYYGGNKTIRNTDFKIVESQHEGQTLLTVKRNGQDVGYGSGRALGMVETNGRAFLVMNVKGQISTLELPKPATKA